jgi:acyl-CoA synthetase (AMP-forming)/AMP-acid ligase II
MQQVGPYIVREGAESFWNARNDRCGSIDCQNFCAFLAVTCERTPDKAALIHRGYTYTYAEFFEKIAGVSVYLRQSMAIAPGSRVALLLENSDLYNILYLGILAADLVAVPLNTKLTRRELEYMLIDSEFLMS